MARLPQATGRRMVRLDNGAVGGDLRMLPHFRAGQHFRGGDIRLFKTGQNVINGKIANDVLYCLKPRVLIDLAKLGSARPRRCTTPERKFWIKTSASLTSAIRTSRSGPDFRSSVTERLFRLLLRKDAEKSPLRVATCRAESPPFGVSP